MPNPTQSDLHVNVPLTSVSVAYLQAAEDYIATKVFPKVPVQKQSDLYWRYSKTDWRRTDVERRGPSTESPGVGWNVTTESYFAHVYAVHKDIDDQLRANADSNFNLDSDSTKFITNQLLLKRDIDWCDTFFKTGVWTTEYAGVASSPTSSQFLQWNNAGSDPINDVAKWVIGFRQLTGYAPNIMVMGANVMQELKNHPDIIDRIKYTQRGIVTEDLIAMLFGVPKIVVAYATSTNPATVQPYNYANTSADNTVGNFQFIANSKAAALYYAPPSPSLMTPSAGYSFTWNGYSAGNSEGIKIKSFRMEHIASDRIEAEMTYDMKVVASDMGIFLADAVA
jgi:hypothetical protein